jgi:hypothetical protein
MWLDGRPRDDTNECGALGFAQLPGGAFASWERGYRVGGRPNLRNTCGSRNAVTAAAPAVTTWVAGPHNVVGTAPVLGNRGLRVSGRRNHHDVAGCDEGMLGKEPHHLSWPLKHTGKEGICV